MKTNNGRPKGSAQPESLADVIKNVGAFTQALATSASPEVLQAASAESAQWFERQQQQKLQEAKLARIARLAKDLGPRYSPKRASFSVYQMYDEAQSEIIARLRRIVGDIGGFVEAGCGLVLYGWVGTGKDHLAAAMLYAAAEHVNARWVNGRDVFGASRDAIAEAKGEKQLIAELIEPAVVCISDPIPIVGELSAWNVDLLYRVLDQRARYLRSTWMTLNVTDVADARKRLTPPVWDRVRDNAELLSCCWPSFRVERQRGRG